MQVRCRRADVEAKRYGGLEACCRRRDVEEAERYGGLEMRRRLVAFKRYGGLEACCGPGDVASKEVWRCAAGVLPHFPQEPRNSRGALPA